LFTVVYGLHHGELARIKVDIAHLIDTFTPPPGFFLPARALMLGFHDAGTWSETTKDGGLMPHNFMIASLILLVSNLMKPMLA